jgi:DNA-binding response OmpR family regulator
MMAPVASTQVRCGALEIDRVARIAVVAGRPLRLTRREYDVDVNHIRKKLGPYAGMLETIRGYGYCLRPHWQWSSKQER